MNQRLEEIAESVDYGVTASAANLPVGPKFLRITDIQEGQVDWNSVPWCECDGRASEASRLKTGDIVFARTGATTGKSYLINQCPENSVFASYLIRVRLKTIANPDFVSHFFQSEDYWKQITKGVRGAAQPGVNATTLKQLQIPLPPLAEQKRIAAILDAADALRTKRREALAQLDALLQSSFLTLFGDPVTNPMGWERKKFSEIGSLDRGVSKHRPRNAPELLGGPYPLVQTGEIANCDTFIRNYRNTYSEIGLKQSKLWPAGTLCITIAANIAKTGILEFEACFPDSVVGFRSKDPATVHFVQTWLSFLQKMLEETAPVSAQKNINLEILRNLQVPLPPLPLQQKFAAIVESVERQKAAQRAHLAELDSLFAALQHRAFRGEL